MELIFYNPGIWVLQISLSPAGNQQLLLSSRRDCWSLRQQGYSRIFFFSRKSWPKKKSQGILASAGLGAEAHRRKENALHWNNEGEAAFAVRPAKGFIELCFRGPLRHVGDTSLLVKEIIIGQKLPINSFRSCKCCQFPLCCSGSSGC